MRSKNDMNMLAAIGGRHDFLRQAEHCRSMGSPFVASVLEAVSRQLDHAPITAAMITDWPGDRATAAVAMRVNGALHALGRGGTPAYLAGLYSGKHDDFDGAISEALSQQDRFIADWIGYPTQTNEVARAAAIMAALMTAHRRWGMPFELLELGSSCGLNLNLARYAYKLGPVCAGDASSTVRIEPEWRGTPPPVSQIRIVAARGVDLRPLKASEMADRDRLQSFAWADQPARSSRLEAALQIAIDHPPRVDRADAGVWLAQRLAERQEAGCCRVVMHSMLLQYLREKDRRDLTAMIMSAGARATVDRPLVRISFEWTPQRREVQLRLTCWPRGETMVLAVCHPYGDWVEWREPPSNDVE